MRWKKTARLGKQEFAFTREGREGQQQERKLKERKLKRLVRSWSWKTLNATLKSLHLILWKLRLHEGLWGGTHLEPDFRRTIWQEWAAIMCKEESVVKKQGNKGWCQLFLSGMRCYSQSQGVAGRMAEGWRRLRGNLRESPMAWLAPALCAKYSTLLLKCHCI